VSEENDGLPVPLNDWVLITPDRTPDVSEGGIIMPDTAKKMMNRGNVMAVGPGKPVDGLALHLFDPRGQSPHMATTKPSVDEILKKWPRRPMKVRVGDVVHYPEFAVQFIEASEGVYAMVKEEDILSIE
jgi:co-chaperonin GroES (HSP10)